MPDEKRDIRKPLDVTNEAMIAHRARFFSLAQFAVLTTEIPKAKGEPSPLLHGWAGSVLPIDQGTAQDCFFYLVDFAKRQWAEQFDNLKGEQYSFEPTATASDVADFPLARSTKHTDKREGLRRNFDPSARPEKGQAVECWNWTIWSQVL